MDFLPEKFAVELGNVESTGSAVSWKSVAGISALSFLGGLGLMKLKQQLSSRTKSTEEIPTKWVKVAKVQKLIIYPVKSCMGVEVDSAQLTEIGLKSSRFLQDRVFMVVDSKGAFQSQRQFPALALIRVEVAGNELTLSAPGMDSVTIDVAAIVDSPNAVRRNCRVFEDPVAYVIDCGEKIAKWLDTYLKHTGLGLVFYGSETTKRGLKKKYLMFPYICPKDAGAFQDETSYMLISAESMAYVNTKVPKPVTYRNFRPTIYVDDIEEPFAEDDWKYIRIQNKETGPILKTSLPCIRCRLTTVNPDTGTFDPDGEPLKTMSTLRRRVGDPLTSKIVEKWAILGNHFGHYHVGDLDRINVGDNIYAALQ